MEYIAVLDVGTSKMLAMAARKNNRQDILAMEQIDSGDSIRRGLIYKTTEAAEKIAELINRLNLKLKQSNLPELKQIYLGVGGQGLRTKPYSVEKNIDGELVSDETLNFLRDKCQFDSGPLELIDSLSHEYFLDGQLEPKPQGIACDKLEVRAQLILGHLSKLKDEVEKVLTQKNIHLADLIVSPVATAAYVLSEREKSRGCVLVELGAGITCLSVYKENLLRYLVAIPLGGNSITKDLCSLDKTELEAEALKINENHALDDDEANKLDAAIEARADEIVSNILHQTELSGYGQALNAGFILTGGASRLTSLVKLLEQKSGKPVRRVEEDPEKSCAHGLLKLGKENCAKEVAKIERPLDPSLFGSEGPEPDKTTVHPPKSTRKKRGFIERIITGTANDLFNS